MEGLNYQETITPTNEEEISPQSPTKSFHEFSSASEGGMKRESLTGLNTTSTTSDISMSSKLTSKASSITSSPDLSRISRNAVNVKDQVLPYPNEETRSAIMKQAKKTEQEFLDYVKTLNISDDNSSIYGSPIVPCSPVCKTTFSGQFETLEDTAKLPLNDDKKIIKNSSKVDPNSRIMGLDQLDNLCKLMEELTTLRDQNTKLQNRVKNLESEKKLKKEYSFSSAASLSHQNSPDIITHLSNTLSTPIKDNHKLEPPKKSDSPHVNKKKTSLMPIIIPTNLSLDVDPRNSRSKSFSVTAGETSSIPSNVQIVRSEPQNEVASPSSKTRSLSNWTKVMVDAFKSSKSVPSTEERKCSEPKKVNVSETEEVSNYFNCSSSSSSSLDFEFQELFDLDGENPNFLGLGVQRSSSFTQSSHHNSDSPIRELHRRHSLTSIGDKKNPNNTDVEEEDSEVSEIKDNIKREGVSSTWGKVKNMIYIRRDSLKKKGLHKSISTECKTGFTSPEISSPGKNEQTFFHDKDVRNNSTGRELGAIPKSNILAKTNSLDHNISPMSESSPISPNLRHSKIQPQLTLTMTTGDELSIKSQISHEGPNWSPDQISNTSPEVSNDSQWEKAKKTYLAPPLHKSEDMDDVSYSLPESPLRNSNVFFYDDILMNDELGFSYKSDKKASESQTPQSSIQGEILKNYEQLQRSLSQEFNKKMQIWDRQRRRGEKMIAQGFVSGSIGVMNNSSGLNESNFPADFRRKYEAWQRKKSNIQPQSSSQIESQPSTGSSQGPYNEEYLPLFPTQSNLVKQRLSGGESHENLPLEFKRKLESWEKMKDKGFKDDYYKEKKIRARPMEQKQIQEEDLKPEFRLKVAEWEVMKAMAGQSSKNVEEIQKMMPDDFNRKLKEWEMMKESKPSSMPRQDRKSSNVQQKKKKMSRDHKRPRSDKLQSRLEPALVRQKSTSQERDSVWLEKEFHKIQREKQRLEREKEKYLEREKKLERMKEALEKQKMENKEITVKTSRGEEFKFGGISETFTRKLYEWEQQKNIAPESSTIALLGTSINKEEGENIKQDRIKEMLRSKSEGSLCDAIAAQINSSSKKGSGGNLSQNSSQSLNDLDKKTLEGHPKDLALNSAPSKIKKRVKLSRTESVRTHNSIQILEENLSLMDSLREKGNRCRELESKLEILDDRLHDVVRSTSELTKLKKEEESEDEMDEKLIVHLGKKLDDLEREKGKIRIKQKNVQDSLAEESKIHKVMASALVNSIETFSRSNPIVASEMQAPLASLEKDELGIDFALIHRVHQLSGLLAEHTKALECSINRNVIDPNSDYELSNSIASIPSDLLQIMKNLRENMLEILRRQSDNEYPRTPVSSPNRGRKTMNYTSSKLFLQAQNALTIPSSLSESDISCGELSTRYIDTDEETNSRISSNNSMSRYGSESPLHPLLLSENHLLRSEFNKEENNVDDLIEAEKKLLNYRFQFLESDDDGEYRSRKRSKSYTCKQRRTSSDNISTPNSGRSRSPSILSSDYVPEEDNVIIEEKPKSDTKEVSISNIDKVCRMIHELKEEDLKIHKRKIEEHQEKMREQSRSTACSSDESGVLKPTGQFLKEFSPISPKSNSREESGNKSVNNSLSSVRLIIEAEESLKSSNDEERFKSLPKLSSLKELKHVLVPTMKMRIPDSDEYEAASKMNLRKVKIDGLAEVDPFKANRDSVSSKITSPKLITNVLGEKSNAESDQITSLSLNFPMKNCQQANSKALRARAEAISSVIRFRQQPKTTFLKLEEESRENLWKIEKSASTSKMYCKSFKKSDELDHQRPHEIPSMGNLHLRKNLTLPVVNLMCETPTKKTDKSPKTSPESAKSPTESIKSSISNQPPNSPPIIINSPPIINPMTPTSSEAHRSAHLRWLKNQKAREKFLFGTKDSDSENVSHSNES